MNKPTHVAILSYANNTHNTIHIDNADEQIIVSYLRYPVLVDITVTQTYDVILIDTDTLDDEMLHTILHNYMTVKIIILCSTVTRSQAQYWMRRGVSGIILHDDLNNFTQFISLILAGQIVISQQIMQSILGSNNPQHDNDETQATPTNIWDSQTQSS